MDLSEREIERAKYTFSIYDFEGTNVIDASKLGAALSALGLNPTLQLISKLGGTKKKGEKNLKVEEFLAIYSDAKKDKDVGSIEDFIECLRGYDKDGEGKMLAAQLSHILQAYGEKLEPEEAANIIKDCCDTADGEGFISYKMFLKRLVEGPGEGGHSVNDNSITPSKETTKNTAIEDIPSVSYSAAKPMEEEEDVISYSIPLKLPKTRSPSTGSAPKQEQSPTMEKKFQMPLISLKTDALISKKK